MMWPTSTVYPSARSSESSPHLIRRKHRRTNGIDATTSPCLRLPVEPGGERLQARHVGAGEAGAGRPRAIPLRTRPVRQEHEGQVGESAKSGAYEVGGELAGRLGGTDPPPVITE